MYSLRIKFLFSTCTVTRTRYITRHEGIRDTPLLLFRMKDYGSSQLRHKTLPSLLVTYPPVLVFLLINLLTV